MDPLIITSNDPMVPQGPDAVEQTIYQGIEAAKAGAAILHHHMIYQPQAPGAPLELDVEKSAQVVRTLRKETDCLIQLGITVATDETRMALALREHVDMMSITIADNDHYNGISIFREREQMVKLARFCKENDIVPEWEVFHSGAVWNLFYMIKNNLARAPHWVNLTLYPEGSCWAPRTMAEVDYRSSILPADAKWHLVPFARGVEDPVFPTISPMEHTRLLTYAVLKGGHVRTGIEDRPEISPGVPAKTNAELITIIAEISERLGRPPATPEQARKMLNMT